MIPNSQKFRFNSENARMMAARAWEARRERKAKLEAEAEAGRKSTPQSERLAGQIRRIEGLIEGTDDAVELQRLTAAHAKLFAAWQVLTETPNPGNRKAKSTRGAFNPIQPIRPTGSDANPQPVAREDVAN